MFERALTAELPRKLRWHPHVVWNYLRDLLVNAQTRSRAFRNGRAHYNLGTDLFEATLDPQMLYSCGYWKDANTLEEAQTAKLELVCRKLGLQPGMKLLDIGCGWGGFLRHAGQHHGVSGTGITVSDDQADYARKRCAGLDVTIRLEDYRSLDCKFDRIASIGMIEHVGPKNYRTFMQVAHRCLAKDGLFLLHGFTTRDTFPNRSHSEVDWINRHIFPGLVVPSLKQLGKALDGLFVVEDIENFGSDYAPTLMAWHANFERNWRTLDGQYDERFRRMWRYYLLICAAAFRCRAYQLWQLVLSPNGVPGGYRRP
jgi:cyclopropane-fatty-acyl-phospholipid synthase